jgi:hypothetical protein
MLATSVILTRAIIAGGELAAQQPRSWQGATPLACDDLPDDFDDLPDELPLESLRQRVKSLEVDGQAASAGGSGVGGDSGASGEREGTLAGGGDAKAKGGSGSGAGSDEKGGSGGDGEDESYYVRPLGYATIPDSEPPRYVTDLLNLEWVESPERNWLDLGFDYRMRYEYRDDDLRRPVAVRDEPLLLRTRGYLGLKEVLDPFRFTVEFEDAGLANSQFPDTPRDVNRNELIQMYAELFFDELPGIDRQVEVRYGRMAFEVVDRRSRGTNGGTRRTSSRGCGGSSGVRKTIGSSISSRSTRWSSTRCGSTRPTRAPVFMVWLAIGGGGRGWSRCNRITWSWTNTLAAGFRRAKSTPWAGEGTGSLRRAGGISIVTSLISSGMSFRGGTVRLG